HKARKLKEKIVEGNNIIKQQAAHIDRQYTTIETNNKKIAKQNKTIDSINEAIKEVEKDKAVMKKLEQELGLRKTAERGFQ
ncbi:hypothetical protein, partial [Flavonifractor plautii]